MIKSRITLKQLEAFAFVVDLGTFRAAAAALGTTQPNISARISALETTLGTPLFVRESGSVRLTEKGGALLERARKVLWASEEMLEDADRRDLIEERLRLGVTELVACTWLQPFLRLFKASYPNIQVELQVDLSIVVDARLAEGQLDLAFQTGPFKSDASGHVPLGKEEYCWLAVPEIADQLGEAPGLAELFRFPVLTHAHHTQAGHALHAVAQERNLNARRIVHSNALSACVPMVCEGLGVALLPKALVRAEIARGDVRKLEVDWLPEPLSFHARYNAERSARFVAAAASLAPGAVRGAATE